MIRQGFEWPAPDAPTCGAQARDRTTGRTFACMLKRGHDALEHFWQDTWQETSDVTVESASWIGPTTGFPTPIGAPQ